MHSTSQRARRFAFLSIVTVAGLLIQVRVAQAQRGFGPRPMPLYPPYSSYPGWSVFLPLTPIQPITPNWYRPPAPPADPTPPPGENKAVIKILLPSTENDIWVDGDKMPTRITDSRVFISPSLTPGHEYRYTIRASWVDRGMIVAQERPVIVRANQTSTVDFNRPAPPY
jgi:uncharacterized protein (TIGR03000 family)